MTGAGSVLLALALCGCASTNPAPEPSGPPAAWVQLNTPVSAAPVEYERRMAPPSPVYELQSPPLELRPSETVGPEAPAPTTTPAAADQFPPLAPGAELPPLPDAASTVPPTADAFAGPVAPREPAVKQAMLDELSGQLAALDQRMNEQAAAMEQAQRQSAAARQATMRLQTEFINWRAELDVVRDTIRAQSAADVRALDELNQALELLLNHPPLPEHSPGNVETPRSATGGYRNRGAR